MLPMLQRWSKAKMLEEASSALASFAVGAVTGEKHRLKVYPTRLRHSALVESCLAPEELDEQGKSIGRGYGITLEEYFAAAAARIDGNLAAQELLVAAFNRIELGRGVLLARLTIVDGIEEHPDDGWVSLWCRYVQAVYPDHVQTPGSAAYEAQPANATRDSQANPFAPWQKVG